MLLIPVGSASWPSVTKNRVQSLLFIFWLFFGEISGQCWSQQPPLELEPPGVQEAVEAVAMLIGDNYFDRKIGDRVAASLRQTAKEGAYAQINTREALATRLTQDLFKWTHDKHLAVTVIPPITGEAPSTEPEPSRAEFVRRTNAGVQRVEVLSGNVGYLQLNAFYRVEEASQRISAAMQLLAAADALILDLRENTGGSPDTVAFMASYFLDAPNRLLFEIIPRGEQDRKQYQTSDVDPLLRNSHRPVYVLTSAHTFSAGEGIAFLLQEQGRATVIGESTAGAANPGRPYPVDSSLEVVVPNGQIRSAIRGSNWEGSGVTPDLNVPARGALTAAHRMALESLLTTATDPQWKVQLQQYLQMVETASLR